jgi:autotransporter-associated beta strand protein
MYHKAKYLPYLNYRAGLSFLLATGILFLNFTVTQAASYYWKVPAGYWSYAPNWGGHEPRSSDSAYINNGGTATINQTGEVCFYLSLDPGIVNMTAGNLTCSLSEGIGSNINGTFNQTGGANGTYGLVVGNSSGASGKYNLSGTGNLTAGSEYIGNYGTGTFNHNAGNNSITSNLYLGYFSGSSGTYNLNGGTLKLKSISQGEGTAAFNFGGGTLKASGDFSTSLPMTLNGTGGDANIDTAGYSVTLAGVLSGMGGLNKLGLGTMTLAQDAIYTGDTIVEEGALDVMNINTPTSVVSVAAGNNELMAVSIVSNSLTIGSGAKVVIKPITGGLLSGTFAPVPEPSTFVLLGIGVINLFAYAWRRWKQFAIGGAVGENYSN